MKPPLVLLTLGLATPGLATLSGCDTVHGLSSRAPLSAPLDVPCISAALSSVEGVVVVIKSEYTRAGRAGSSRHAQTPEGTAFWIYRFGGPQPATLQIRFDDRGRGSYSNSLRRLNARVLVRTCRSSNLS